MMSPTTAQLQRLVRLGFRAEPILDEDGHLDVLVWIRQWRGWREVVLVYSEHEARAYRSRTDVAAANPLYVRPGTADVLLPLDTVVNTVHALLALPAPPGGMQPAP